MAATMREDLLQALQKAEAAAAKAAEGVSAEEDRAVRAEPPPP